MTLSGYITIFTMPVILIAIGLVLLIKPPAYSRNAIGYRSKRALESREKWNLAQKVAGIVSLRGGIVNGLLALFGSRVAGKYTVLAIMAAECLILIYSWLSVEGALKKKYRKK
ncbi:MAG: SdpI family protein [Oscillospiraceae bacterium]|nr:SdpI family protein [Oscillospiraceae bacterium]